METRTAVMGALLLLLGCVNTLVSKYQDMTVVGHTSKGEAVYFQHPSVQCGFMFLGEFLCLIPYFIWKWMITHRAQPGGRSRYLPSLVTSPSEADLLSGRMPATGPTHTGRLLPCLPSNKTIKKVVAFIIPACCDAAATILLYTGLMFTYASTFQMLRGTMVLWCGLLTICVLRRNLHIHHWVGICMIAAGVMLVTASSVLNDDPTQQSTAGGSGTALTKESDAAQFPLFGAALVILGQLVSAVQFVVEEVYLAKFHIPALLAVGLEGFWGLILCFVVLPILSTINDMDGIPLDDVPQAFQDILAIPRLQVSFAINMVCIAAFNFLALVVTSELSAGWRAAIDTLRTIIIWTVSVVVFEWEYYHGLQVLGFAVLVAGMSLYNELMRSCLRHPSAGEESPFGSGRGIRAHSSSDRGGAYPGRGQNGRSAVPALQEPLLGEPGSPRSPRTRGVNMPGSLPRSPSSGRPPLHPNSFGNTNHFARSLTYNPDVLSPHSLGSFVANDSLRSGPPPSQQQGFSTASPAATITREDSGSIAEGRRGMPTSSLTMSIGSARDPPPPTSRPDAA